MVQEKDTEYILFVSQVCLDELGRAKSPKKENLFRFLDSLRYIRLPYNPEAVALAEKYVESGILTTAHWDDLRHVAYAVCAHCDHIISWNMKHLVNDRTIDRLNAFHARIGLPNVSIITPTRIIGEQP
jgi:hypothetical protein